MEKPIHQFIPLSIQMKKEEIIMAIEKVKELIKAIQTDPKAKELLKGASEPKSEEDMIRLCAEVAPKGL